ncbi:hypothetical protein AKI39_04800 [Bordetella sp. H567]|uniref:hypothetical protein n=1 Tax=Bordetella sp. H567 TaxID=1697043 RepID=UPI00081D1CB1|nr:hypothetical protein [Bordetella sp. H567]AOB30158.1 hypothetical protein AKI39_04800 [Bordetella sp. H567]
MHFFVRRRACRAALAAALACCVPMGAHAAAPADPAPSASNPAVRAGSPVLLARLGRGLDALAPALPMPVKPPGAVDVTAELPPCQPGGAAAQATSADDSMDGAEIGKSRAKPGTDGAEPGKDGAGTGEGTAGTGQPGAQAGDDAAAPKAPGAAAASADAGSLDCAAVPTAAAEAADAVAGNLDLDYVLPPPGSTPVKWGRPVGTPKPWFASVSPEGGMQVGDRSLTYRNVEGPSVSLGSLTPFSPAWSSAATIGGVQVSNLSTSADTTVPEGKLGYSSVWGRIDNTDPGVTAGGVQYGAPAGSNSVRYGLTPDITVEGQVQSARALTTTGLGTTYSMGQWGTVQGGATQSRFDTSEGWRYSLGYNVKVFDTLKLGYGNELTSSGYGDLASYQDGTTATTQWRNTFSAGVPISGWGELSGTYSGLRDTSGEMLERRYGISQSMMLSPNVRLAVGADHDVVTGDYGVNMQLTMPIGGR